VLALVEPGRRAELVFAQPRVEERPYKVKNLMEDEAALEVASSFGRINTLWRSACIVSLV
jgi:hypothetical protein